LDITNQANIKLITREQAVLELKRFIGQDIRALASSCGVTVFKNGKLNKGWAGLTLEQCIGLSNNSLRAPNGGTWELKLVPLVHDKSGKLKVKETMAITMINATEVMKQDFEHSHLFIKLRSLIICGRVFESKEEKSSRLHSVGTFDLNNREVYNQVKADYEDVRKVIREKGFNSLTGKMGILVQPRTKGAGHGSNTRAFYARTGFVKHILGL
jgi:DNA mismatch repair protein MutH